MVEILERPGTSDPSIDVSMVVNIHAGGHYLRRTMSSLEAAARVARDAGLQVELLLMLDRSPEATRQWVDGYASDAFRDITVVALDNGSLGLSRQDGIDQARGRYIQFCDEDDLISSNTTVVSHALASAGGPERIVVPEFLFGFGSLDLLAVYAGSDVIPPLAFFSQHPYVSRLFVHRDIASLHRFVDVRLGAGYAYEDWHFNATVLAKGAEFVVAPDVVLYYRHRSNSLLSNMNTQSARLIPPTPLFDPVTFLRLSAADARRFLKEGQNAVDGEAERDRFLGSQVLREETRLANLIDPAISITRIAHCPIVPTRNGDYATGVAYAEACRRVLSRRFNEVALVSDPTGPHGEAALAALRALRETDSSRSALVLIDAPDFDDDTVPLAIANAVVINLARLVPGLSPDQRDLVAYRLIEMTAQEARLHLAAEAISKRVLGRYGRLLTDRAKILYRGDDRIVRYHGTTMTEPDSFDVLSEYVGDATLVIHASQATQRADQARLDGQPAEWRLAYLPANPTMDAGEAPLHHRVLAVGWTAGPLDLLRHYLTAQNERVAIVQADTPGAYDGVLDVDVVLLANRNDASYRDLLRLLQAGVTIVAPRSPATTDILAEGKAMIELEPDDVTARAQATAVKRFYAEPALRERLREATRIMLTKRHTLETHRNRIASILTSEMPAAPSRNQHAAAGSGGRPV